MKALVLIAVLWIVTGGAASATTRLGTYHCDSSCGHVGAPAPLIGVGLPALSAIGGLLLGARLLKGRK